MKKKTDLRCMDCGMLYSEFGLDTVLPNAQWMAIHSADGGVLCANCIVKRAAKLRGATCAHMIIEIAPRGQSLSTRTSRRI